MSDKQIIMDAIHNMSDTATFEEISEAIAILAAIRRAEIAVESGRALSHQEVKRRSATWSVK